MFNIIFYEVNTVLTLNDKHINAKMTNQNILFINVFPVKVCINFSNLKTFD